MNWNSYRLMSLSCVILLTSCGAGNTDHNGETSAAVHAGSTPKLNISILLDLSDRISPEQHPNASMAYYKRDLGYIASIARGFTDHVSAKRVNEEDEYLQVFFEPEPSDGTINNLARDLKASVTKASATKTNIQAIAPKFTSLSTRIYAAAIKNKMFIGSDIWTFFKNKAHDYCIKPGHRNILFILTDGYMYHQDSKFQVGPKTSYLTPKLVATMKLNAPDYHAVIAKNGYGFVTAADDLSGLEVVVIGINPAKGNPFEGDVICDYWLAWLKSMKICEPIVKPIAADLPSNVDPIIQKIINSNR